jgi:hypothetical protein
MTGKSRAQLLRRKEVNTWPGVLPKSSTGENTVFRRTKAKRIASLTGPDDRLTMSARGKGTFANWGQKISPNLGGNFPTKGAKQFGDLRYPSLMARLTCMSDKIIGETVGEKIRRAIERHHRVHNEIRFEVTRKRELRAAIQVRGSRQGIHQSVEPESHQATFVKIRLMKTFVKNHHVKVQD